MEQDRRQPFRPHSFSKLPECRVGRFGGEDLFGKFLYRVLVQVVRIERLAQLGNCGVDFRRHCLEDTEPALTPYVASLQPKSPADLIKVEVLPAQLGYLDSLLHGPVGIEMGLPSLSVSQPFARSGGHDEPTFAPVLEPGPQRRKLRGRQPVQNLLFR